MARKTLTIRVDELTHELLGRAAAEAGVSVNALADALFARFLQNPESFAVHKARVRVEVDDGPIRPLSWLLSGHKRPGKNQAGKKIPPNRG